MTDLAKLTIEQARIGLESREFSAVELTKSCIEAIENAAELNAFVHNTPELALKQASEADELLKAGSTKMMSGIPIGVKDLFCTKDIPSQAGSSILKGFKPNYESTITHQLWEAGAVMLGKLNMDEFAMGSSNETSTYGDVINPWKENNSEDVLGKIYLPLLCKL